MKKVIVLIIAASLLLTACSCAVGREIDIPKESDTVYGITEKISDYDLTAENEAVLVNSADVLTKATSSCVNNFSSDPKNPTKAIMLSKNNPKTIVTFLIMMMKLSDTEENNFTANTYYSDIIYKDKDNIYHVDKTLASNLIKHIFNIPLSYEVQEILVQQLNFKYDEKSDEYFGTLDFGTDGTWFCKEIIGQEINKETKEITVEYCVENEYAFAADAQEEIIQYICRNVYTYDFNNKSECVIKLKIMEIKDFIITTID